MPACRLEVSCRGRVRDQLSHISALLAYGYLGTGRTSGAEKVSTPLIPGCTTKMNPRRTDAQSNIAAYRTTGVTERNEKRKPPQSLSRYRSGRGTRASRHSAGRSASRCVRRKAVRKPDRRGNPPGLPLRPIRTERQSGQGRNPTRSRCRQTWHRVARRTATRPQERTRESIPTDRQSTRHRRRAELSLRPDCVAGKRGKISLPRSGTDFQSNRTLPGKQPAEIELRPVAKYSDRQSQRNLTFVTFDPVERIGPLETQTQGQGKHRGTALPNNPLDTLPIRMRKRVIHVQGIERLALQQGNR